MTHYLGCRDGLHLQRPILDLYIIWYRLLAESEINRKLLSGPERDPLVCIVRTRGYLLKSLHFSVSF